MRWSIKYYTILYYWEYSSPTPSLYDIILRYSLTRAVPVTSGKLPVIWG